MAEDDFTIDCEAAETRQTAQRLLAMLPAAQERRRTREDIERIIVAAVRECVDTPFLHQGRTPGVGLDCLGTLEHAANRVGFQYQDKTDYRWMPDGEELLSALRKYLVEVPLAQLAPGCALLFWIKHDPAVRPDPHEPRHLSVVTEQGPPVRMVHAFARSGPHGDQGHVQEQELTDNWRRRIHSVWRFPEGTG